jgi:hypothetical protein
VGFGRGRGRVDSGIQEAIFEEKSSGFFSHKKRRFFLATKYKQDYIWISY